MIDRIREMHSNGATQQSMAESLNVSIKTIRRLMKKADLKGHSVGVRSYTINSTIFDNIDMPEKAYWLGFLLADGCLAKSAGTFRALRLSIQDRDQLHLEEFARFVGYRGKLHVSNRDGHRRVSVVFNDVYMGKKLIELGWLDYKTGLNSRILDVIPDDLFSVFVRGYFDGDGCISSQKRLHRKKRRWYANIVCKYEDHLEAIKNRIIADGGPTNIVRDRKGVYALVYQNLKNVETFHSYIYKNGYMYCLLRKKLKFNSALVKSDGIEWNNMHDFRVTCVNENTEQIILKRLLSEGWSNPKYDVSKDLEDCKNINLKNYLIEGEGIRNGLAPGNKVISHYQPIIFRIRQNNTPCLADLIKHEKHVRRATQAFLKQEDKLYPARLLRELKYTGLSSASLLSVPVILAAIKNFGLKGKWFDPCAGWGNRLLVAYVLNYEYEATDPGVTFEGLKRIQKFLGSGYDIQNKKWQDYDWKKSDFILTSPPFYNKEDYLDGVNFGTYEKWELAFFMPLIRKCKVMADRVVLHVDNTMLASINKEYDTSDIKLYSVNRHKAPNEWFTEIKDRITHD